MEDATEVDDGPMTRPRCGGGRAITTDGPRLLRSQLVLSLRPHDKREEHGDLRRRPMPDKRARHLCVELARKRGGDPG
jgi:hypothetical protein